MSPEILSDLGRHTEDQAPPAMFSPAPSSGKGTFFGGPQNLSESKKWRGSLVGTSSSPSPLPQSKEPLSILALPWVDGAQPYIYTQCAQLAGNVSKNGEGRLQHHSSRRLPCGRWRVQSVLGDALSSRHRGRVKSCLPNCSTHDLKLAVVGAPRCSALTCNADLGKFHPPAPALPERHLILKAKAEKHYFHT